MSAPLVTIEALIAAFDLPPGPAPRRVPKSSLADHVSSSADKRLVEGKLARLEWIASINPAATGIAAAEESGLAISAINMLCAYTRGPMPVRLGEIIHRSTPLPVILIHTDDTADAQAAALSLAPRRSAEREAGRAVVTALHDTGPMDDTDMPFVETLALARLAPRDLAALYSGLIERVDARAAARAGGRAFRLSRTADEMARWRNALRQCASLEAETAGIAAALRKETRLSSRVDLGEKIRQLRIALNEAKAALG
ncbi:DUF4391 domain-containing protein [Blastomonas fulva]|uniref:DUF4391 domain-containing protein n=1 Tax=Blastomonas fulva TaxID=1550728 RepID=UPI0040346FCA